MNKEEIIQMAQQCGLIGMRPHLDGIYSEALESFAKLVAEKERERIKSANAPEIERVNAHIKKLEDEVLAEREACAKICDEFYKGNPNINYSNTIAICIRGRTRTKE